MSEETITQNDVATMDASALEGTRTEAQKRAAEILANRAKGKPAVEKEAKELKAPKEKKERAPVVPKGDIGYRFLRDIDASIDKLNNQQKIIVDAMLKLVDNTEGSETKGVVMRKALIEALQASEMVTRQPHDRVFGFYLNSWKKNVEATEKKAAIPTLLEVVKIVAPATPAA